MQDTIFQKRRKKVFRMMENNSVALIESASEKIRNNDVFYSYRQCSNFFYLTGHEEPDAILVLSKRNGKSKSYFFTKKPTKIQETWTGAIDSSAKLKKKLLVDECHYHSAFDKKIYDLINGTQTLYHSLDLASKLNRLLTKTLKSLEKKYRQGIKCPSKTISFEKIIHQMRLIKSTEEVNHIKKACTISVRAHKRLMKTCRPGITEYEIGAELIHEFTSSNSKEAYPMIVASGKNACTLHYMKNNCKLKNGDLLLTDAAAEYKNYASDITRTIPISGKFTKSQKLLYEIVLEAQKNAIKKCVVGKYWGDIHKEAVKTITKGLIKLGFIKGNLKEALDKKKYEKFYMHSTGHWLGLDVHDPCEYPGRETALKLKAGMIFTVEPGIYIKADKSIPSGFHNTGIRIEDDVLVSKGGPIVLTSSLPKEIRDIEKVMNRND
ncbi:MAG: aminopeptidase P N-terminal domain-containing protein [Pseudomonadota bacterium]|nr:aminopeptidase P N-terminal domain-containing protein [Pseudomonadota bacterium]